MRYETHGFGPWAVVLKGDGGSDRTVRAHHAGGWRQRGAGSRVPVQKGVLHHGYALEAATACRIMHLRSWERKRFYSIIRENNGPSERLRAKRNDCLRRHHQALLRTGHAPPPVSNQPRGIGDGFGTEKAKLRPA